MVKVFTVFNRRWLAGVSVAVFLALSLVFSQIASAQYGVCNYSEGSFSSSDHSCQEPVSTTASGGRLGDTGSNWQYLLFAGMSLLASISLVVFIILVLRNAKDRSKIGNI